MKRLLWVFLLLGVTSFAQIITPSTGGVSPFTQYANTVNATTGSGTEASPWTNAVDHNGGIETAVTALGAVRGGLVRLPPGRFNYTTSIDLADQYVNICGEQAGDLLDPNGESEGHSGTKIRATAEASGIVIGNTTPRTGYGEICNILFYGFDVTNVVSTNAGINIDGATDQFHFNNIRISNYAYGIYNGGNGFDSAQFNQITAQGNKHGISWDGGEKYVGLTNSMIGDNTGYGLIHVFDGQSQSLSHFIGNSWYRNCGVAADCPSNPSSIAWPLNSDTWVGNVSEGAGICTGTNPNCPIGQTVAADGFVLGGSNNVLVGNVFADQTFAGTYGIHLLSGATHNLIGPNGFDNVTTPIRFDSGANDNYLLQPGAVISDAGSRNILNGVSSNAGDPASTGVWNGVAKWAGLQIWDTTNSALYLYTSPSTRFTIGGAGGTGTVTAVSAGTGMSSTSNPITVSGTLTVDCDPLNMNNVCISEEFMGPGTASGSIGSLGWATTGIAGGSVTPTTTAQAWPHLGVTKLSSNAVKGQGGMIYANYPFSQMSLQGGWDSFFGFKADVTSGIIYRVGYNDSNTLPPGNGIYLRYDESLSSFTSATYTSGGSVTGTVGQTCNVVFSGGTATGTIALTGTNVIAGSTAFTVTAAGAGYEGAPNKAVLSNGTATCSGTATITAVLGAAGTGADTKYMLCSTTATTFETCSNTGVALDANWHKLEIKGVTSGTISMSLDGAAAVTFCSAACTVTTVPTTISIQPFFAVVSNTTTTAELLYADYWRFKGSGVGL